MPRSSTCSAASFTVSSPINFFATTYNHDRVLTDLKKCGVTRVLLCGQTLTTDVDQQRRFNEMLPQEVAFYKANGLEVWFWRWAFIVSGSHTFTHTVSYRRESPQEICPLDPDFRELVRDNLTHIAMAGVDGILYDDDFRFGNGNIGLGCLCPRHLKQAEALLGHEISLDNLEKRVFFSKPNPERSALLKTWGNSLIDFAAFSRAAVDAVNPNIRLGFCACMSGYDGDGTTVMELAPVLAGNTRPYVRLIGAPYWAVLWAKWGMGDMRIPEIIEYERWQISLMPNDFEVFTEGDVYPRPRFQIPASYLELFDSALRFDGHCDGIQKYMFDYTSTAGYETGYAEQHLENQEFYLALKEAIRGTDNAGIRVWQDARILEHADFSDIPDMEMYIDGPLFYPQSAFALAAHGLPATHTGNGIACICFGESARTLPDEFRHRPLILDITAARLLTERGWDVGLTACGERFSPTQECFLDGEIIPLANRHPCSRHITIAAAARAQSHFNRSEDVASYVYRPADGSHCLVFNIDGTLSGDSSWRNYRFPATVRTFLADCNALPPAVLASPVPDFYMQCRTGGNTCVIGFWNAHADRVRNAVIQLTQPYTHAQWLRGSGSLKNTVLNVENIPAFSFAAVKLTR